MAAVVIERTKQPDSSARFPDMGAVLTFWTRSCFVMGAVLCMVSYLVASLNSTPRQAASPLGLCCSNPGLVARLENRSSCRLLARESRVKSTKGPSSHAVRRWLRREVPPRVEMQILCCLPSLEWDILVMEKSPLRISPHVPSTGTPKVNSYLFSCSWAFQKDPSKQGPRNFVALCGPREMHGCLSFSRLKT